MITFAQKGRFPNTRIYRAGAHLQMVMDDSLITPSRQPIADNGEHIYRYNKANRVVVASLPALAVLLAAMAFMRRGNTNMTFFVGVIALSVLFAIRGRRVRIVLTSSQVIVVTFWGTTAVPFAEICGRRSAQDGLYLSRSGKPRVLVPSKGFERDNYFREWVASIYDLDRADRVSRRSAGTPHALDAFYDDNADEHCVIGVPKPE